MKQSRLFGAGGGRTDGHRSRPPHGAGANPNAGQTRPPKGHATNRPSAYRDADHKLRPALFDEEAQAEAERWKQVKSSQLRRFYGAVVAFVRKCDVDEAQTNIDAKVSMALLKASATYAAARDRNHRPIAEFFNHHASLVDDIEAYRDFSKHFETIVAYHKALEATEGSRGR